MKRIANIIVLLAALIALSGCGHQINELNKSWQKAWYGDDSAVQKEYDAPSIPAPANNKFGQIKLGMDYQQVWSIMGMPTSFGMTAVFIKIQHDSYINKNYIEPGPYNVEVACYKGYGTVFYAKTKPFSVTKEVIKVSFNPDESGFRPVNFYEEGLQRNSVLIGK